MKRRSFLRWFMAAPAVVALPTLASESTKASPADIVAEAITCKFDSSLSGGPLYISLFTQDQEVSGNGYARGKLNREDMVVDNGSAYNAKPVTFPSPKADWGYVDGYAIFDSKGNMLFKNQLIAPKSVHKGNTVMFMTKDIYIYF